jgi:autotransporter-associated beta strand protein
LRILLSRVDHNKLVQAYAVLRIHHVHFAIAELSRFTGFPVPGRNSRWRLKRELSPVSPGERNKLALKQCGKVNQPFVGGTSMNSSCSNCKLSIPVLLATACALFLSSHVGTAASATWSANPSSSDWNSATNWTPMTVPNGPNDIATFQTSSQQGLSLSSIQVSAINFSVGANSFSIASGGLTISGTGITNDSGLSQRFYSGIVFSNSASAGVGALFYGNVQFHGTSTASSGTFNSPVSFYDSSTAGNATFNGQACFHNQSTVGSAVFNGGACFADSTTADNATINGATAFADNSAAVGATLSGNVSFSGNSTGDLARVIGGLNIASHAAPGVAIGSIEGNGNVVLGNRTLTVGANNINTTFSGTITGLGSFSSLTKIGTGTLALTNSNAYYGGTTINSGTVQGLHDHALGEAPVNGGSITVAASAMLALTSGATNDYIADPSSLQLMTGSLVSLNFLGAPDKIRSLIVDGVSQPPGIYGGPDSGAPNQLPEFTGTGQILVNLRAVSRKLHGAAGTFDVDLPIVGSPGIECRSGGANSEYQMVVTFYSNVTFSYATVLGIGQVTSASGNGTNTITIDLAGVGNAQTINVGIVDVNDGSGPTNIIIPMSVLVADVNGNGFVNASDVAQVKAQLGPVGSSNFRADINANGAITASDVVQAKVQSGTHLP